MIKKFGFIFNIVIVAVFSITPLRGMDQVARPQGVGSLVLSIALYNRHLYFDHDDICSFALVNRESKKTIRKTAQDRRSRLKDLITLRDPHRLSSFSPLTWHKCGSMCAGKKVYAYVNAKHHNAELGFFVFKNNDVVHNVSHLFSYNSDHGEYQSLFNQVKIMEQEVCCYGFDQYKDHMFEYSFSKDVKYRKRSCMMKIDNEDTYSLAWLVKFPALFTAVFNATVQVKKETEVIYDLNSVIIPDNYKEVCASKYSFEVHMLPALQRAMTKRYEEQPKK